MLASVTVLFGATVGSVQPAAATHSRAAATANPFHFLVFIVPSRLKWSSLMVAALRTARSGHP